MGKHPRLIEKTKLKLLENMSLDQLELLIKDDHFLNDTSFFNHYFNLKFREKPNLSSEQKMERLMKIIEFYEKAPERYH